MNENILRDELFPLQSALIARETPILYCILKRRMNAVDFLENDKDLKLEVADAVKEVEVVHDAVAKKEQQVRQRAEEESLRNRVRHKLWRRKQWRYFVTGFLHFAFMSIFIVVFYQTHNQFALVTESFNTREELCMQILKTGCAEQPLVFRKEMDVYSLLGEFQEQIENVNNVFTQHTKLHPWLRVTAVRVKERKCVIHDSETDSLECQSPLYMGDL